MTEIEKIMHWAIKTLFEGQLEVDDWINVWSKNLKRMTQKKKTPNQVRYNYILKKRVNFLFPDWGKDYTTELNVSFEGNKTYVTGSLFSGGYYELNVKTLKLEVHN